MGIIKQNKYQQDRIRLLKQQELQKNETLSPEILLQRAKEEELKRYAKLMKGYTVDELVQESLLQPLGGLGNKEKNKNRFLHSNFYTEKNVKPLDPFLRIPRNKVLPVIFTDQRTAIQLYHESTSDRKDVREAKRTKIKDNAFVKNENFNSSKYSKARQEQRAARTKKQEDLTKLPKVENDGTESPAKAAKGEQKLSVEDPKGPNSQIAALNIDQLAEQIESPQNSRSPGRKLTQLKPEVYKIVDTTSTRVALTQLQELRQKKERKMLYLDGEPPNEEGGAFQPTGTDEKQTPSGNKGLVSPEMRAAQARKKYLEVDPTSMLPTQFLKEKDSWIKGHKFGLPATDFPQ